MSAMKTRLLTLKDKNLIAEISYWQYYQWGHIWANNSLEKSHARIATRTNQSFLPLTLIAYNQLELLGFACLIQYGMWYKLSETPWLDSVYVKTSHRQQGVGAHLIKQIISINKKFGYTQLFLFTPDKENFYKNIGWTVVERANYEHEFVSIMKINTV